jgi:hypothetical protein
MRREKMNAKFLGFVATLTPRPELVKMLRETVESVWVERYREVDARLSKLHETISDLRKRRTQPYQAHIEDRVPTDVFMESKAALDAETTEAECKLDSARIDEIKVDEVLEFCERAVQRADVVERMQPRSEADCSKLFPGGRFPTSGKQVTELRQAG